MTHEELNAALVLTRRIERLQARLDTLRETGGVGAAKSAEPVLGGCGAVPAGQVAQEMEFEITELHRKREVEQEIIRRYIVKTPLEDMEQKLLLLRYVECRPHSQAAVTIGYSGGNGSPTGQYWRIHDKAKKTVVDGS